MQLALFAFSLFLYFAIHSLLASHSAKNYLIDRWINKKYYRLFFNAFAILSLFPVFITFVNIESTYLFVIPLISTIGMSFVVLGILLLLYGLSQYNLSEFSGTEQLRTQSSPAPQVLKTSGFNGLVRHPLYFAGLIIIWGGFIASPTVKILIAAIVATLYLYFGTKLEEKKLVLEFGEEYKKYQKRVGMLIPFLKYVFIVFIKEI